MTDFDREAGAILLRRLRESRGWSWSDLARALRETARRLAIAPLMNRQVASIQRTVARWESPTDRTSPGDRYQFLLAQLYGRTPAGRLKLGPGSDFGTLLDALRSFGTPPDRIRQLVDLISQSTRNDSSGFLELLPEGTYSSVVTALRDPSRLAPELLNNLDGKVKSLNEQVGSTPFVRLQLQLVPIVETCRRFLSNDRGRVTAKVQLLATDVYALAARLAFETRDDDTAMALYAEASEVSAQLEDKSHLAAVRTSHTMVTLYATGDLNTAQKVARTATVDAHRGTSHAIRARAHAVHSEICARAGQAGHATAALDRAWKTVDQLALDDPHGGFNADRLNGFEGLCALYTGDAEHAHDRLERSLASLSTSRDAVQRGIVSTDLALARLRLDDPAASAELLHEAVNITATTGGRVPAQRIRRALKELRPWRAESFVAALDDHIHETLIGR